MAEAYAGVDGRAHTRLPYPVDEGCGIERLHNLRAFLLAVEIAPRRVVEVGACKVVRLLRGSRVCGTLRGCPPSSEVDRMLVVEHLLERKRISERVVERAFDHAFRSVTSDDGCGECPSVLVEPGGILHHQAEHIVGVCVGEVATEAGGILGSVSREV